MSLREQANEAVERGAAFIDARYPDALDNIHPESVRLMDSRTCPLAQAFGTSFYDAYVELRDEGVCGERDYDWFVAHGFMVGCDNLLTDHILTITWQRYLRWRQGRPVYGPTLMLGRS